MYPGGLGHKPRISGCMERGTECFQIIESNWEERNDAFGRSLHDNPLASQQEVIKSSQSQLYCQFCSMYRTSRECKIFSVRCFISLQARTGFPFIDAIMTQLRQDGWIHHLARHAVACFLTRGDLWINWEEGQRVCERTLYITLPWIKSRLETCCAFF